jgi:2-polyprenyl-3-methyl-5-hydroxy-6-metoxy-1,4-benzoquinol methylase
MAVSRLLLACPHCGGRISADWSCRDCTASFEVMDGVPDLRLASCGRTETVRRFYAGAPFPGYAASDTLASLRARAERNAFVRLLDLAIPPDARIVEVGCGTGQMSLYLARADRQVIGADLTRQSLLLGADAARRFGVTQVQFIETDLRRPGLALGAFDVVYCSGVLHHTPDPRGAFANVARLARPGGLIVLGLYNVFARMPMRLRRVAARLCGYRWIPFDPVLNDRRGDPERRAAWLRDQYLHPEEHRHTLGDVRSWFAENDVDFVRAYPSALLGDEPDDLLRPADDHWPLEALLAQVAWIGSLGREGGLFVTVGRRAGS